MQSPKELLRAFESLLDPCSPEPDVEISTLRRLAARGVPLEPPHLRSLTYSLLLGTLPKRRAAWPTEQDAARRRYHDLSATFLGQVERAPEPTVPLSPDDAQLAAIAKDIRRTQSTLGFFDQPIPVASSTGSTAASPKDRRVLSSRLAKIAQTTVVPTLRARARPAPLVLSTPTNNENPAEGASVVPPSPNPSIMSDSTVLAAAEPSTPPSSSSRPIFGLPLLEFDSPSALTAAVVGVQGSPATATAAESIATKLTGPASLSSGQDVDGSSEVPAMAQTEPAPSSSGPLSPTADLHSDALIRILYVFAHIHPHLAYAQGFSELLAPLYWVFSQAAPVQASSGIDAEGDAFWAFVALLAEVGDIVRPLSSSTTSTLLASPTDGSLSVTWALRRLSMRLRWADQLLWEDLRAKSLDPAEPYYAYRWVGSFLTQDFPLVDLLRIWDAILSEPAPERGGKAPPKVDLLLDVCTAMLLRARRDLLKAGARTTLKISDKHWAEEEEHGYALDASPGGFGEGFVEGMAILQRYPTEKIGGLNSLLDLAFESRQRRLLAELDGDGPEEYADVLRQLGEEDPDVPQQPQSLRPTSASKFADAARRRLFGGAASAEGKNSPVSPSSPVRIEPPPLSQQLAPGAQPTSRYANLLRYAEQFKESDTAAALSKRSSNLTAAALVSWGGSNSGANAVSSPSSLRQPSMNRAQLVQPPLSPFSRTSGSSPRPMFADPIDPDRLNFTPPPPFSQYQGNHALPHHPQQRLRSDSVSTTSSVLSATASIASSTTPRRSLQDRLAASTATPPSLPSVLIVSSTGTSPLPGASPKPLLLSASARATVGALPHAPLAPSSAVPSMFSTSSSATSSSSSISPDAFSPPAPFSPPSSITSSNGGGSRPPWADGPASATSPPPSRPVSSYAGSESETGSTTRVPIGARRTASSTSHSGGMSSTESAPAVASAPAVKPTFLRTTPKTTMAGIRLRERGNLNTESALVSAGLSGNEEATASDRFTRPPPRSSRVPTAQPGGRSESIISVNGVSAVSDAEPTTSSRVSRLSQQFENSAVPVPTASTSAKTKSERRTHQLVGAPGPVAAPSSISEQSSEVAPASAAARQTSLTRSGGSDSGSLKRRPAVKANPTSPTGDLSANSSIIPLAGTDDDDALSELPTMTSAATTPTPATRRHRSSSAADRPLSQTSSSTPSSPEKKRTSVDGPGLRHHQQHPSLARLSLKNLGSTTSSGSTPTSSTTPGGGASASSKYDAPSSATSSSFSSSSPPVSSIRAANTSSFSAVDSLSMASSASTLPFASRPSSSSSFVSSGAPAPSSPPSDGTTSIIARSASPSIRDRPASPTVKGPRAPRTRTISTTSSTASASVAMSPLAKRTSSSSVACMQQQQKEEGGERADDEDDGYDDSILDGYTSSPVGVVAAVVGEEGKAAREEARRTNRF